MNRHSLSTPGLIANPYSLQALVEQLAVQKIVAVDTESNSLYAYQEQVCLIQFSTSAGDYLVDPLALPDLGSLAPLFADPEIEKVFHAAEYDLICLRRDFGFSFNNLFDTMWAARLLGREAIGLSAILEEQYGVQVDKRYQRANWGKRPLPKELSQYARQDTHYLIPLRDILKAELQKKGLWELAEEDFRRMTRINGRSFEVQDAQACWQRISGMRDLEPRQLAVLRALCELRDEKARQQDQPLFKIINDQALLAIADACPSDLEGMQKLDRLSTRQVERMGRELLKAVQEGLAAGPLYPPKPALRPDPSYADRMEALRDWRKREARRMGVESDVVLPRDLMVELVRLNPGSPEELSAILKEVPWRLNRYGETILAVLRSA